MLGDKSKKRKSKEDEENNGAEAVDAELLQSIEKLQEVQDELEKINEEASEEVLVIEQKYNEIRKPVYDKRNNIIQTIPDFWLTAFMSHPALSDLLTEEDQQIFKYLSNLEVEDFKDVKSGYTIKFIFNANPYFEDTELTKTFNFLEGSTKITSTSVKWKEGMGIPNGVDQGNKGKKRSHVEESFFTWFSDAEHKDEGYEIQDEVADIIKDDLWPNPIQYFNNDADEEGLGMDDDDDDENGSDDTEDDDDDDDDDDEQDDEDNGED